MPTQKKRDRHKTSGRWKTLTPDEQAAALAHVPGYVSATPDKQYRKDPLTYLNGKCWLDEDLPTTRPAGQPATPAPAAEQWQQEPPVMNPVFVANQEIRKEASQTRHLAYWQAKNAGHTEEEVERIATEEEAKILARLLPDD